MVPASTAVGMVLLPIQIAKALLPRKGYLVIDHMETSFPDKRSAYVPASLVYASAVAKCTPTEPVVTTILSSKN